MKKVINITLAILATLFVAIIVACSPEKSDQTKPQEGDGNQPWAETTVECYNYAPSVIPSSFYTVTVNGQIATTLPTTEPHVCLFGCDGLVEVKINNLRETIESVVVRPVSKNYTYSHDGNTITLYLQPYDKAVVEINGDETNPLFVFANPLECARPQEDDPNVTYLKAGKVYGQADYIQTLQSGKTLYIEGGAILTGSVVFADADNVSIEGCGVIDSRTSSSQAMKIGRAKGLTIENVTVLNQNNWTTYLYDNEDVLVDNYKVVAVATTHHDYGAENDSCNLLGCKNAVVKRSFGYCHDDAFCIKSQKWQVGSEVENVEFEDCIAWNVGGGNSFVVGYELNKDVNNVRFRNVYAIRTAGRTPTLRRGAVSVHNGAGGKVTNILYDGVWVEDPREYGIYMRIIKTNYDLGSGIEWTPGEVDGVVVRNANFLVKPPYGFHFQGYDDGDHRLKNITLENITIAGEKLTQSNASQMGVVIKNADVEIK